jgi:hypothetical protein
LLYATMAVWHRPLLVNAPSPSALAGFLQHSALSFLQHQLPDSQKRTSEESSWHVTALSVKAFLECLIRKCKWTGGSTGYPEYEEGVIYLRGEKIVDNYMVLQQANAEIQDVFASSHHHWRPSFTRISSPWVCSFLKQQWGG